MNRQRSEDLHICKKGDEALSQDLQAPESSDTLSLGLYGQRHLEQIQGRFDENIVKKGTKELIEKRLAEKSSPKQREQYRDLEQALRNHPVAGKWFKSGRQEHIWARQVTLEVTALVPNRLEKMVSVMNKHLQNPQAVQALGVLQRNYDAELLKMMNTNEIDPKLTQAVGEQGVQAISALFTTFTPEEKAAVREWQYALYKNGKAEKPKTQNEAIIALLKMIFELLKELQKEENKAKKKEKIDDKKEKKEGKNESVEDLEKKQGKAAKKIETNKERSKEVGESLKDNRKKRASLEQDEADIHKKLSEVEDDSQEEKNLNKQLKDVNKSIENNIQERNKLKKEMQKLKKELPTLQKELASIEDRLKKAKAAEENSKEDDDSGTAEAA